MVSLSGIKERIQIPIRRWNANGKHSTEKAMEWLKNYEISSGITISHNSKHALPLTQETAGYLIPTLYHYGEKDLARKLARWEVKNQRPSGAFTAVDYAPYTFDTAQVIRGFLTVIDDMPELETPLRKACNYVTDHISSKGKVMHDTYATWRFADGSMLSEYGNVYVLPPLLQAGEKLREYNYIEAARRSMDYYRKKPDLVEFKPDMTTISHYLGYILEALADLGESGLALKGLKHAADLQMKNGAIPAYPGANWVCSTGIAQIALAWYKLGITEPADKAISYLESIQNDSGGFYGSYGNGGKYFPNREISWAAKFFLDAYLLKIATDFNKEVGLYSESINERDGRVKEILSFFGDMNSGKVIDVGCGKGRFLRILKWKFPEAKFYGIDISENMISHCPQGVETKISTLLNIKYPSNYFDFVFCVEALEHALFPDNAIRELARILKSGGKLVIIDKNLSRSGTLKTKRWEKWFNPANIQDQLRKYGVDAAYEYIAGGNYKGNDKLFVAWKGTKNG